MPHVEYRLKSIAASFKLSPFPLPNQRTPQCSRRQLRFSTLVVRKLPAARVPAGYHQTRAHVDHAPESASLPLMGSFTVAERHKSTESHHCNARGHSLVAPETHARSEPGANRGSEGDHEQICGGVQRN